MYVQEKLGGNAHFKVQLNGTQLRKKFKNIFYLKLKVGIPTYKP